MTDQGAPDGPSQALQAQMDAMSVGDLAWAIQENAQSGNKQLAGYLSNTLNSRLETRQAAGPEALAQERLAAAREQARPAAPTSFGQTVRANLPAGERPTGPPSQVELSVINHVVREQQGLKKKPQRPSSSR